MKRVYKLLETLRDNGLSKTYSNSIDNLGHLKVSLLNAKNEIDDKIIDNMCMQMALKARKSSMDYSINFIGKTWCELLKK